MPLRRLTLAQHAPVARFGIGTLIFLGALALRVAVLPIDGHAGFITFYPALVLVLYLCGTGPGLWVLLLSAATAYCMFYPPYDSWRPSFTSGVSVLSYVLCSLVITLVMRTLQNTNRRLRDAVWRTELAEARLKGIISEQTDVLLRFDPGGAVTFANEVATRILGARVESGPSSRWKGAVHAEDLPQVLREVSALGNDQPQVRFDCRLIDTQGRVHWFDFIDQALFDSDGRLLEIQSMGRDISQRKQLEQQLRQAESELRDLYDNAPCGYYSLAPDGTFLRVNRRTEEMLGLPGAELVGRRSMADFAPARDRETFEEHLRRVREGDDLVRYEMQIRDARGEPRQLSILAVALRDDGGRFVRTRSVMLDVTELHHARKALEQLVREQQAMLDNDVVGIVKLRERHATWVNRAFERMFGYAPGEMLGLPARVLYPDDESHAALGREAYAQLAEHGRYRTTRRLVKKNGEPIWVDMNGATLSEQGDSLWLMLDITALKSSEQRMTSLAYHDALTGLPNRALLLQFLERELATRERLDGALAICFVDLDGFKPVNDAHGHEAGDTVLRVVAERLLESVRGNDIVARLGGDEFIVALTHLADSELARHTLRRLLERLRLPIRLPGDAMVRVSASIGVALCPRDGRDAFELLRRADQAMYRAKAAGRDQVRFHDEGIAR